MPLFRKKENMTDEEKKLSVVSFWLFVIAVFAWVLPFTVIFLLALVQQSLGMGNAFSSALLPSLISFGVTVVLCLIVYFAYRKLIVRI